MKTERKREAVLLIAAFRISSMCVCFCFSFSFCALHNEQQAKLLKKAKWKSQTVKMISEYLAKCDA